MQTIKAKADKTRFTGKTIAITAMFAALVTVATAFIKIPAPLGYAHAGDSMVYLAACALPAPFNFIAAGLGGALADLISGYAVWSLPTAIIKALNVLPFFIARFILSKKNKDDRLLRIPTIVATVFSAGITIGGYYIANCIIYDIGAAAAEIPFNIMQSLVGTALFLALGLALDSVKFRQRIHL